MSRVTRRLALAGVGALALTPLCSSARADADVAAFRAFLATLEPAAERAGVAPAVYAQAIAGLTPDPSALVSAGAQPEFETPIWDYLKRAVGPLRVARGRQAAAQWRAELSAIERRYRVPGSIILAAWGMEADFSQPTGTHDALRALATLAWTRPHDPTFRTEFFAALHMIQAGVASRAQLRGSWAGAMGMPQFMPSAYLRYAVGYRAGAPADIWTSVPDALASIANFFVRSGWDGGLPWGFEARLPAGFDWRSLHASFAEWTRLGLVRADRGPTPRRGDATLFAPAGATGPCFLLSSNYWVIKDYDNSDSYALSLGLLADAIAGRSGLSRPWPRGLPQMPRTSRMRLQRELTRLRLYDGAADGKIGPATREAIHRFEIAVGLNPADGFPTPSVLAALESRAALPSR